MSIFFEKLKRGSVYYSNWVRVGILLTAVMICVLFNFGTNYANAASVKIKYDGKKQTYTGAQTQVTLDGEKVDLGVEFGIIINNTCLVPAEEVFSDGLDVDSYYYSKKEGTIVIEQHDITITMTIGSKTAFVNGEKKEMDVAPKKVKIFSPNRTRVYVPARFVAENLGYSYVWNNSTRTSEITSPMRMKYNDPSSEWIFYTGEKANAAYNGIDIDVSAMPGVIIDDTLLIQGEKVFKETIGVEYNYNPVDGSITLKRNDVTIVMYIDSKTAFVNGMSYDMGTAARLVFPEYSSTGYVMIPAEFTAKQLGYSYSWNSGTQTASISRINSDYTSLKWDEILMINSAYNNMVKDITVSHKNSLDVVSITSAYEISPVIAEESTGKELQIEISGVYNQIQAINKNFTDGIFINGVMITPSATGISITLTKNNSGRYYTSQSGNTFQIIFCEDITTDVANSMYQMKFALPEGVSFSSIKDKDKYYENTFVLTLKGDHLSYFNANPILYNPSVVSKIMLNVNGSGNTEIKVITHKLQGYRINDCGDYVGVNIANPSQIYDKIVVLDAGHGGKDPGALNSTAKEKDLTYAIIYELAKEYFDSKDSDIKAYWTRRDDTYVALSDRAAFASSVEADLFISLHMNSASSTSAKGLEVLYGSNNKYTMSGMDSKEMASIFKKQLIDDLNMTDRGIKDRPNLVVLKSNEVPAILIELGFMSNADDFKKLNRYFFQNRVAASIYEATKLCFEKYPTGR